MLLFVGDDWAEDHHDVHLMNEAGERLAAKRFPEGLDGTNRFCELIAEHSSEPGEVVIGIETDRGMWVQYLVAAGYEVFAVNPLAVSRYRDRHSLAGAKSDPGDAKLLADLVRTDRHNHRSISGDTADVEALKILARGHQNLIWARTEHTNRLRNALREYFPAALETFDDLHDRDCLAVLGKAPTPTTAASLTQSQIRSLLVRAGRQRNIDKRAVEIRDGLRKPHMEPLTAVAQAFAATTLAAVAIISELNKQIAVLEGQLCERFDAHNDAGIYLSQPGLGLILGPRVLAEFGDDPTRYETAKSRKNYAGTSPITIASGRKRAVTARHVRNERLYDAVDGWAFAAIKNSPGAKALYDRRRAAGDIHHQALRAVANRLVGILHGCLRHRTNYDETIAWNNNQTIAA